MECVDTGVFRKGCQVTPASLDDGRIAYLVDPSQFKAHQGFQKNHGVSVQRRSGLVHAREHGSFVHRILANEKVLQAAAANRPEVLEEAIKSCNRFGGPTVIGALTDWHTLEGRLNAILPPTNDRLEKVILVDGIVALVRRHEENYSMTYDPAIVRKLVDVCEHAITTVDSTLPRRKEISKKRVLKDAQFSTAGLLGSLLAKQRGKGFR